MSWRITVGLFTLVALLCSAEARPQEVANSLDDLRDSGVLQPGDRVYVTDTHGQRMKGTLRDLVADSLVVTVGGEIAGATIFRTAIGISRIGSRN